MQAHARTTDPDTSHEAARSLTSEKLRESQAAVRKVFIVFKEMSDTDLQIYYKSLSLPRQSTSGLRTRRRELVDMGILHNTGKKVLLESGRRSIVWGLTL